MTRVRIRTQVKDALYMAAWTIVELIQAAEDAIRNRRKKEVSK